jgi:hypothetical protein
MSGELLTLIDGQRAIYLKNFLTIFSISIVALTLLYYQAKHIFPYALSIALFLNLGSFMFFNNKYKTFVQEKLIPSIEKEYKGRYHKQNYLNLDTINSFNIFSHDANSLKSEGYIKNDESITEFLTISFVKKDTEENEIENTLFSGKVVITTKDLPEPKCQKDEYFEAGEKLKSANKRCKIHHDGKFYYFYSGEKLFPELNIFVKYK